MLLRFPFPEGAERLGLCTTNMDVRAQQTSTVTSTRKVCGPAGCGPYKGGATITRLALVSLVFLLRATSPGTLAARASGDVASTTGQDVAVVVYDSGIVSPRIGNQLHFDGHLHLERRRLLQSVQPSNTTRLLAVRGDRRDPLNSFHKYRGGYDVKNKHYWASAIYTGVYGFAIGVAWLLLGLLLALAACCKLCCCRNRQRSSESHSSFYHWFPRLLVLLLSLFAIGCIIPLFIRNKQFHTQAFLVRDSISSSASDATNAVHNVSSTLTNVNALVSKYNIAGLGQIGSTVTSLNQQADKITNDVNNNIHTYNRLFNGIEIALWIILGVALFLVVAGLLSALLGWRVLLFLIIVLGWLLTALTWILFGLFFAVNNVTSDTCQAFGEYLQAPANTTLDGLLPCVDAATASSASTVAKQGVSNIIVQANNVVTQIQQTSANLGRNSTVSSVCNPIGPAPAYTYPTTCPQGTVSIGQLPQVLQPYVCSTAPLTNQCLTQGRIVTPTQNSTIGDFSQGGQSLVSIIPTITSLTNCSFVYNTFDTIVTQRCGPAKRALRNLWIPLLLLSIAMTLLTTAWILANHRNKKSRSIHAQGSPRLLPK